MNMDEITQGDMNSGGKNRRTHIWIALTLIITLLVLMLALYFSRFLGRDARLEPIIMNTAKVIEMISQMRIDLSKSTDLEKGAVMAITDEESKVLAEQSHKSSDAVERGYLELRGLIDAAGIDNEMKMLKEFSNSWNNFQAIDKELLSLAVENTNLKAANLSYNAAAQAMAKFDRLLSELMDIPTSDSERAQIARLSYQAATAAYMIYSLEAPHIAEAQDKKMDEMENLMGMNERRVRNALRNLSGIADQQGRIILNDASSVFSKFMEVHKEVIRLSRLNTNVKSLELSLGRKRQVAAQCEEILKTLQDTVQNGRSIKATR